MLTNVEIAKFEREGYLVFESIIQGERLDYYRRVFDDLVSRGETLEEEEPHWTLEFDRDRQPIPGLLHKVQGVCVVEPKVLELAKEPAILDRVEPLLGPNIDVFGTKFFPKLPEGGTSTHWHQDNFYFGTDSDRIVSCGIYLEDADAENGCLKVVPGSHRVGIFEHKRDPSTHGSWTQVDEEEAVDVVVPAGSVAIFSANLLHGSNDNHSSRTRYSTAWHYLPGDYNPEKFPRGEYADRFTVRGV